MPRDIRGVYEDVDDEDDDRFTVCYKAIDERLEKSMESYGSINKLLLFRFQYLKETVYIRKKTFPRVKQDLLEMIEIIKKLFIERIHKCDWMDESTKALALKKAENIKNMIGADDELYDIGKFDRVLGLDKVQNYFNRYILIRKYDFFISV